MTIIRSVLATFLVAFMLYVFTARKRRELAIMKALGTTNVQIYSGLAFLAFCVASTGLVLALLLGLIAAPVTRAFVPQNSLLITADTITRVAIVSLLVSIFASLLPARRILRNSKISFIFQAFNLLDALTVEENILFPATLHTGDIASIRKRAGHLIDPLGLSKRRLALPKTLSVGEKQRATIARALINNPPLILADEPTGNLDSHNGQEVMMILHDIIRNE